MLAGSSLVNLPPSAQLLRNSPAVRRGDEHTSLGPNRAGGGRKLHCSALKVTVKRSYKLLFKKKSWNSLELPSALFCLIFTHKSLITGMRYLWGEELKELGVGRRTALQPSRARAESSGPLPGGYSITTSSTFTFPSSLRSAETDRHCQRPLSSADISIQAGHPVRSS